MTTERRPSELARLSEVRRVGSERTTEVATILAGAFAADPLLAWLLADVAEADMSTHRVAWWRFMIRHAPPGTELHVTGDGWAAACWHPAPAGPQPPDVVASFRRMVADLAPERATVVVESLARIGRRAPAEPHWHLAAVGVAPDHQSTGLGSRLLAPMLARCDRLGMPAYLESSNRRNLDFYRRLGFRPTGQVRTVDGQVALTLMWRSPATVR